MGHKTKFSCLDESIDSIIYGIQELTELLPEKKAICGADDPDFLKHAELLSDLYHKLGQERSATMVLSWAMTPLGSEQYTLSEITRRDDDEDELLCQFARIIHAEIKNK